VQRVSRAPRRSGSTASDRTGSGTFPRAHGVEGLAKVSEPLAAILLVAAAVAGFTGDLLSVAIVLAVVSLSIFLDVLQEHRAEVAAESLKRSVAVHSDALRDHRIVSIPVENVVPGDVIELRAGDLVPADGVVLQSRNAHVNEALMTGEPYPV
jgi:P-type Mg2+ transporter